MDQSEEYKDRINNPRITKLGDTAVLAERVTTLERIQAEERMQQLERQVAELEKRLANVEAAGGRIG